MNRGDGETDRRRRFVALCENFRPDLLRFAWWLGRDRSLAEDLSSSTFERALRMWRRFDPNRASARTWLCQIARSVALGAIVVIAVFAISK